jgi:hypothetical protein
MRTEWVIRTLLVAEVILVILIAGGVLLLFIFL